MSTRSLPTLRPSTDIQPVSGLSSPFPVLLGGTERVRVLRRSAGTFSSAARVVDTASKETPGVVEVGFGLDEEFPTELA